MAVVRMYQVGLGVVEQRRVAAPAERIAVLVGLDPEEEAALLELFGDGRVGVLDEAPGPRRHLGDEAPLGVDRVDDRQVVLEPDPHVLLAEGRGDVDDPGAVGRGDVVAADDVVRPPVDGQEDVRRLVLEAEQLGAAQLALDDGLLAEHLLDEVAGEDEALAAALDEGVVDVRVHRRGDVADERPGRGRPDGERDGRAGGAGQPLGRRRRQPKAHEDGVLDDVLVALGDLVARERRAAARAVRDDLEALVEQPLVVDAPQQPPDASRCSRW